MTNEKQPEEPYKAALLAVLASTTEAELPPALLSNPEMIAELLVDRFRALEKAEKSVASLMELGTELAARGDRWKQLAGRAYDTLTKKPNEHWQKAAELASAIVDSIPIGQWPDNDDVELFDDALASARAAKETPEEVRLTYRQRYITAAGFTAAEQLAERIQIAFRDAVAKSEALAAMAQGIKL